MWPFRKNHSPENVPKIESTSREGALPTPYELLKETGHEFHFFVPGMEGVAIAFDADRVRERAQEARVRLQNERELGATALPEHYRLIEE